MMVAAKMAAVVWMGVKAESVGATPTEASLGTDGYARSGDVKIHYVTAGQGPLPVMIHGFPDYRYTWRQQMPTTPMPMVK